MSLSNNVKQAAALKYQLDKENSAPMVVASGMGVVAQKIVDVAIENNVPIFEDDSLSALLSQLEVGREVPIELFQAIVDIYVYFLNFTLSDVKPPIMPTMPQQNSNNQMELSPINQVNQDIDEDESDGFQPF